jgi:hypothetical protein
MPAIPGRAAKVAKRVAWCIRAERPGSRLLGARARGHARPFREDRVRQLLSTLPEPFTVETAPM